MSDVITNFGRKEGTIQADAVTKAHLVGAFLKMALIAGGAAGDHTVTGNDEGTATTGDKLVVVYLDLT